MIYQVDAGSLRHLVTFRRSSRVPLGNGRFDAAWETIARPRARIEGLDGRESMMAQALEGISFYRLTTRWRPSIGQADQVVLRDGTALNIRSVSDPDGRRRWLIILADTASTMREP